MVWAFQQGTWWKEYFEMILEAVGGHCDLKIWSDHCIVSITELHLVWPFKQDTTWYGSKKLGFGGCWRSKIFGGQCQHDIPFWNPQTMCNSAMLSIFKKAPKKSLRPQFEAEGGPIPKIFLEAFKTHIRTCDFMKRKIWNSKDFPSYDHGKFAAFGGWFLQDGGC